MPKHFNKNATQFLFALILVAGPDFSLSNLFEVFSGENFFLKLTQFVTSFLTIALVYGGNVGYENCDVLDLPANSESLNCAKSKCSAICLPGYFKLGIKNARCKESKRGFTYWNKILGWDKFFFSDQRMC